MANENAIQATGTFITRKGLSLITKLVADKGTLSFSRGAVGVGRPPEGYSPDSMIALSSYKMDAEIADYGVQDDKAFVTLQISSDQVAEGFLLTEVGLYATDPDEGEVLYAYMDISTDPTYIYANGSATRTKFAEFTLYVLIGTVERVTAAVTPGSIITKDTFKADKLPVSDTSGILGEIGKVATGQAMFDALAHKVVEELVTNNDLIATLASYVTTEALTTKLAEYILKNKIVDNFLATSADTVLSGTMGAELKRLLDVLNTNLVGKNPTVSYYLEQNNNLTIKQTTWVDVFRVWLPAGLYIVKHSVWAFNGVSGLSLEMQIEGTIKEQQTDRAPEGNPGVRGVIGTNIFHLPNGGTYVGKIYINHSATATTENNLKILKIW